MSNRNFDLFKNRDYEINIRQVPTDTTVNNRYIFKSRDLIDFNGRDMYKIDSLTKDAFYLSFHSRAEYDGAKVSSRVPAVVATDYRTNKSFSLQAQKGAYVIVDFWGSWCKPCIEALPELVAIQSKYKRKDLKVLSLSYDNAADVPKIITLIDDYKLDWNHILIDKKGKKTILNDFKVQAFPSVFLIDPRGTVVVRGEGKDGLTKVNDYLADKFK